ncbi:anthranilate synthase component I family protein [Oenococcus sp. UCMA 14587]|nr:anthranilate synthase component I family protein [Oenococcus sp. UCMA 14587]
MKKADLEVFTSDYQTLPVTIQFKLENFRALNLISHFRQAGQSCFLLTIAKAPNRTFIGYRPKAKIHYHNGRLTVYKRGEVIHKVTALKPYLEKLLKDFKTPHLAALPAFTGGLVGYFAYDYARYANPVLAKDDLFDPDQLNDVDLLLVDSVITYDQDMQIMTLSKLISTDDFNAQFTAAEQYLVRLKTKILQLQSTFLPVGLKLRPLQSRFDLPTFTKLVEKIKKHIYAGDIFQLILSNPQHAKINGSLLAAAEQLFTKTLSPYRFYFQDGSFEALGASPETLVKKQKDKLFTYPLAGTRRRGENAIEDLQLAKQLQHSPKELAEHSMLVDLGRNDLGRVSLFGSVRVDKYRQLLRFSQVMHLASTIESKVDPQQSALDIIEALMPAGTLSGAPKICAMQLISAFEKNKRGLYGGCFGYLDFNGDLDFCIGIRLAYRQGENLTVSSGAGIVADSIAKDEYQECQNKARSVILALQSSQTKGGQDVFIN